MRTVRIVFLAVDLRWEDPAGEFASFSYAAKKLEASIKSAPDLGHVETHVVDLPTDSADAFFEEIVRLRPTIVLASAYIWSVATFLEVARRVKAWDPSVRFVLGGPAARVSLLSLAPYRDKVRSLDAVAPGEGEEIVRALARDASGEGLESIADLLLPHALGFRSTPAGERPELDAYASPYQIGTAPHHHTGFIETFRGCPMSCAFCQWGDERSDRVYGAEYLASHLRGLVESEVTNVFFTDAAFNLSPRGFRNLMEAERQVGALARSSIHGHFYPTHVKDEHIELLRRAGKSQVSIGVQSFDPEVLRALGRPFDLDRFEGVLRDLRGTIPIDVEIIFGLPGDNPASFLATLDRTMELADSVRVFYPLVLPDALLERVDEFGIRFDPVTFMIEESRGWSAREMARTWEALLSRIEGMTNRVGSKTWVGFRTRSALERSAHRSRMHGSPIPADAVLALATSLGERVTGWSIAGAGRDARGLLVSLGSPAGAIVLEVVASQEGARSFARRGGLAYSYRGSVDRATAGDLGRVIDAIHPATTRLLSTAS
jgi:radical SAM superfamily enzyme YgiQ (UPF0313 family)